MDFGPLRVLAACLLGSALPGQFTDFVHPPHYKDIEAPLGSSIPFGVRGTNTTSRQFRYQQVHDSFSNQPLVINSMRIRRNGPTRFDWQWYLVEMEVSASTSPNPAASANANFAANVGQDVVKVMARTNVFFPGSIATETLPQDFEYWIPFG